MLPTCIIFVVVLTACNGLCQQADGNSHSLPDAPVPRSSFPQTATEAPVLLAALDDMRRPVTEGIAGQPAGVPHPSLFDVGHFGEPIAQTQPADIFTRYLSHSRSAFGTGGIGQASPGGSLVARAGHAAWSTVMTRDQGRNRLNTPYLLRVLTSAVAQSAYRPYWKRSVSQPFGNFGSTVGSDAGMNVFHEFKPGILELVKNHTPKFVSRIEQSLAK